MDIVARVLQLADLLMDLVYQSIDTVGMDGYLLEIAGCLCEGISPIKPYCPIAGDQKQRVKSLSSNQLFLGVFQSPRRDPLLHAKSDAWQSLHLARAASPEQPEAKLRQMFSRQLNLVDLRPISRIVATRLFLTPPDISATRHHTLEWFGRRRSLVEPVLMEITERSS